MSETKVRGNGVKQIGDVVCVYSGVQEGRAKGGVAILLSMSFGAFFTEWRCIYERIVRAVAASPAGPVFAAGTKILHIEDMHFKHTFKLGGYWPKVK